MDESWRMRMGMPTPKLPSYPPRRSAEDTTHHRRNISAADTITTDDFSDVFGGPPRTVLSRQYSANSNLLRSSSSSTVFSYEDIFRKPEKKSPAIGRTSPQFSIPEEKQKFSDLNSRNYRQINGFYNDIFGWDDETVMGSRSRSKTSSSSVLSSEELSPLRPTVSDGGDDVSLFASKLRPINVRSRWNPARTVHEDQQRQQNTTPFTVYGYTENDDILENLKNSCFELSRRNASPETINLESIQSNSFRFPADDLHLNSPSSAVSSVSDQRPHEIDFEILRPPDVIEQDGDEYMSSYVIEINPGSNCEPNGVDEAIAWAKEKFQKSTDEDLNLNQIAEGRTDSFELTDDQQDKFAEEEETSKLQIQTQMQILDGQIRLWSSGKESDIRLLLSSLHNILWPNSGWSPISLTNMIESSQVKKAYQKARLCLHPDKLQQRGATITQKYIAERVFSILQDAWAGFISHDVF